MYQKQRTPLAIVGMACHLPGASSLEEYWRLLIEGGSAVGELPANRLDRRLYFCPERGHRGKVYTTIGALCDYSKFLRNETDFSADTTGRSDLSHVVTLQVAVDALRNAGKNPFDLPSKRVGLFVGHTRGSELIGDLTMATLVEQVAEHLRDVDEFRRLPSADQDRVIQQLVEGFRQRLPHRSEDGTPHVAPHMLTSLISGTLGLQGPSMTLNAACASSLHALLLARQAFDAGQIELALVGGATYSKWDNLIVYSHAQSVSARGSFPFDAAADGLVAGEGYVLLAVKALHRAVEDGDRVHAVVRDVGVSSDGRGKSLWAPRKEGQVLAIKRAYEKGVDPASVQYIEAHATSTPLGDSTELAALDEVLGGALRQQKRTIPIGSVKANIGHTLETAGAASLIKTVLAMKHATIPAQTNFKTPSPKMAWSDLPFYVPTKNVQWRRTDGEDPRRAAVNAFGIGGLNAHVVVDEHIAKHVQTSVAVPVQVREGVNSTVAVPPPTDPIAIIGMGCVFPGARNVEQLCELRQSDRVMKSPVPAERWDPRRGHDPSGPKPYCSLSVEGGFVTEFEYDWKRHRIPPLQIARANPLQFMILDAVDQALGDAGLNLAVVDRTRIGVVVGTRFGSDFADELQVGIRLPELRERMAEILQSCGLPPDQLEAILQKFADRLLSHMPALLDDSGSFSTSTLASRIAKTYDLMGGALALDTGKASSLAAILSAVNSLRDRSCDLVICAAGQRQMGLCTYEQLSLCGNLGDDFFPAEGAGVLLLKRLADAQRDDNHVHAVIHDVNGSFHHDLAQAFQKATQNSLARTAASASEIVVHENILSGISSQDGPLIEAVNEAFGVPSPFKAKLPVSKQIGHALGASGMLGVIDAVRELQNRQRKKQAFARQESPTPKQLATVVNCDEAGSLYHVLLEDNSETRPSDATRYKHEAQASESVVATHSLARPACMNRAPTTSDSSMTEVASETPSDSERDRSLKTRKSPPQKQLEVPRQLHGLTVLPLAGSPYEIGLSHGRSQADKIRRTVRRYADLAGWSWHRLPDISREAARPDVYFGDQELEELQGIADGAGVARQSVVAHNLHLYPDLGGGCIHLMIAGPSGSPAELMHAANEDIALVLKLSGLLERTIQVRRPIDGIAHLVFASTAQFGGITGINHAGIAVTSAMLLDRPRREETFQGRVQAVIVNRILKYAASINDAIEIVRDNPGTGSWGLCLSDHTQAELAYVEYDGQQVEVERRPPRVLAANHVLLFNPVASTPDHSRHRLQRLEKMLNGKASQAVELSTVQNALRDRFDASRGRLTAFPTMNTICRVDNDISVVMQPARGEVWITRGSSFSEKADEFVRLDVRRLLGATDKEKAPTTAHPSTVTWKELDAARQMVEREAASSTGVCNRFVLRMVEGERTGASDSRQRELSGAAIILGDDRRARALQQILEQAGTQVDRLPTNVDRAAVLERLDRLCESAPRPHLFLITPNIAPADPLASAAWTELRETQVDLSFWVCQRWYHHVSGSGLVEQASVVAVADAGGDFGTCGTHQNPLAGGLSGLIKALKYETDADGKTTFRAKFMDVSGEIGDAPAADLVLAELSAEDAEIEIAYSPDQRRWLLRPVPESAPVEQLAGEPRPGTWIVTGGARGVTPIVARQLGKRYGLKLHLLGTTSLVDLSPQWKNLSAGGLHQLREQIKQNALAEGKVPVQQWRRVEKMIEADRNLQSIRDSGVQVRYHCCDISDRRGLSNVLERIRQSDGPITGVLHGAGFEASCRFTKKTREAVSRTFSAKADGAAALMHLTLQDPVQHFIAFGSMSGRFGNVGQTDYSMANDLLSKLVQWYRTVRPDCRSVSLAWHSWGEVGMAVRPEYRHAKNKKKFRFMPTAEGVQHVVDEIRAGVPEGEVVITDWNYYRRFFPNTRGFVPSAPVRASIESAQRPAAAPATPPEPVTEPRDDSSPASTPAVRRRVLELIDRPLNEVATSAPRRIESALLVGDNADAQALRERLEAMDAVVEHLPIYQDAALSIAEMDWIWERGPAPHLFLMTGRDPDAAQVQRGEHWRLRSEHGIRVPLKVAEHWLQLVEQSQLQRQATLTCITSLGGNFGMGQAGCATESATLAAGLRPLAGSLKPEHVLILDAPRNCDSMALAEIILKELNASCHEMFVAYAEANSPDYKG